jgi:2-amino-4-hydroxy-6-hydroxymethyldihydropteridine diphosphokinase
MDKPFPRSEAPADSGHDARRMVLGLGSNLGDRVGHLQAAVTALRETPGVTVLGVAPLYESPPAGGPEQGDYLNSAVLVDSALPPQDVLAVALGVERRLGRVREAGVRWGPRTLDIDVLWIEGTVVEEPGLSVPHPHLGERVFALRPLLDLVPDARDPRSGAKYSGLAAAALPLRELGRHLG